MDLLERFKLLKEKVDSYNASVLDKKIRLKQAQEKQEELLKDLQTLGYNTLEEAIKARDMLQPEIENKLTEMESKMVEVNKVGVSYEG